MCSKIFLIFPWYMLKKKDGNEFVNLIYILGLVLTGFYLHSSHLGGENWVDTSNMIILYVQILTLDYIA
jgi:hypothetical protein